MTDGICRETIDATNIDPTFVETIVKAGADRLRTCIQCGTCSGVCPSGRRTAFRTRELIRKALLGLRDEVLSSPDLWLCATCLTCLERCPRQIKVSDAIIIMRNMAVRRGFMLPQHRKTAEKLVQSGHAVPLDDANREMRAELGLMEIPPTTHSSNEALKQVKELMRKTGFEAIVAAREE